MKQEIIGAKQLFLMMLAFEIGSAVIFGLGAKAKQDAWLAMLIGMVWGFISISVFLKLCEYYPGDSLIQIIQKMLGKFIGYPLCITYIFYFTYQAARISRDFAELMLSTILIGTPSIVIMACFVAVIIYTLRGGIEVFGRMAELVFPIVLLISIGTWIIIYASGVMDLKQLTPVLGAGMKNVWKEAFPFLTVLPFGELIVFTMVWPALKDSKKLKTVGMAVVLTAGVLLSLNIIGMISVLGSHLYGMLNYPLLSAIRMASVADFLERIDAVVIMLMVAGGFFKVGAYIFAASVGTAHLFKLQSYHSVLVPLGTIIIPLGQVMSRNGVEHFIKGVEFDIPYVYLPLQFVIPSLLLVIAYFHKRVQSNV